MDGPQITLLVTLTGRDRPGVTSRLFSVLSGHELTVRRRAGGDPGPAGTRSALAAAGSPDLTAIHQQITSLADDLGMDAEITMGSGEPSQRLRGRLHVTVLGRPLLPSAIAAIAGRIAAHGANIDRIGRLASRPVTCLEFEVSGADPAACGRPWRASQYSSASTSRSSARACTGARCGWS